MKSAHKKKPMSLRKKCQAAKAKNYLRVYVLLLTATLLMNSKGIAQPTITSVSPGSGFAGVTTVTITGTGFNSTATNNIISFGSMTVPATTITGTTSLSVTVPNGAIYAPISVVNTGNNLTGYQNGFFLPTYDTGCFITNTVNFKRSVDLTASSDPICVVLSDVDGDGKPDIVVCERTSTNKVAIYRNTSTSGSISATSFASPVQFTVVTGVVNVKAMDLDGDGKPEIIATGPNTAGFDVLRNTSTPGTISFAARHTYASSLAPFESAIADFDGDGKMDIAIISSLYDSVCIYRNLTTGPGAFTSSSFSNRVTFHVGHFPKSMCAADIDGDGKTDLITSNSSSGSISVLRNTITATGTFTTSSFATKVDFVTGLEPQEVQTADLDGDGKPEIIVCDSGSNTVSIFYNTATAGSITSSSLAAKVDLAVYGNTLALGTGDINGDGKIDIIASNAFSSNVSVLRNTTTGTGAITSSSFAAHTEFSIGFGAVGTAVGDLDGDNRPDIVVANSLSNTMSVLRNYPLPFVDTISGNASVCVSGSNVTYTNNAGTGLWSMTHHTGSTITTDGIMTPGATAGNDTITYMRVCFNDTNYAYKVIQLSTSSTGTTTGSSTVCQGATTTLSNSIAGGSWSSNDNSIATVSPTTGIVTGISGGSTIITYTTTGACGAATVTKAITINPLPAIPADIIGPSSVCAGSTTTLTDATSGGAWSSGNTSIATIGATTGVVTGIMAGSANISYTMTNSCGSTSISEVFTVHALPDAGTITGTSVVCAGSTTTMTDPAGSGAWSSSDDAAATIDASTGIVTGVAAGTTVLSYIVNSNGCTSGTSVSITVNPLPVSGTISGTSVICVTTATTLSSTISGGVWMSSNTSKATADASSGTITGVAAGSVIISYNVTNSCGTATSTKAMTVNIYSVPIVSAISGSASACIGVTGTATDATTGGVWSSTNPSLATITSGGVFTGIAAGVDTITYKVTNACTSNTAIRQINIYALPGSAAITGATNICLGTTITLTGATAGGTWARTSGTSASIGSTTGVVTPTATGVSVFKYTVTSAHCGSNMTLILDTVKTTPATVAITGASSVIIDASITLTDAIAGGVWSSSDNTVASVSNGVVTGISGGSVNISYTLTNTCGPSTVTKNVSTTIRQITGTTTVCATSTTTLSDASAGGVWSSSNDTIATVSSSGVVTGVSAGSATITYTYASAFVTKAVTVYAMPLIATISGATSLCTGGSITLSASVAGGTWSRASGTSATIGSTTGVVTATSTTGANIFRYTMTSAHCGSSSSTIRDTVQAAPSIPAITGSSSVIIGSTITLTDVFAGGAWNSSDATIASVSGGVVTGISGGTINISYSATNMCGTTSVIKSVSTTLRPITGTTTICATATTTLSDASAGGVWSSSDNTIATVSSAGILSGVAAGTATITYTYASAFVTKGVTINATPVAATISGPTSQCTGGSITLSASVAGGTWTRISGTSETINSAGVVTAASAGASTFKYTTTTPTCGSAMSSYTVTAVSTVPSVAAITGSSSVATSSSITLADATAGGTWSSCNSTTATVNSMGVVNGATAGSTCINYAVTNACGTTTVSKTISVLAARAAEISNTTEEAEHIKLYPNPNTGIFTVDLPEGTQNAEIIITDLSGKIIEVRKTTSTKEEFNLGSIARGIYLIDIIADGNIMREKLQVQ